MDLESIISITGKPGLFKVLSQTKNGLIVESILDGKRMPVYASDKVSALNDISVYTNDSDVPLNEVYDKIYKKTAGKVAIDHKASLDELRSFLKEVIEDFDQDRVYHSDLKKLFMWFNILIENNLLKPETKKEKENKAGEEKKEVKAKPTAKKPKVTNQNTKLSGAKGGSKTAMPSKRG
jgi:hypothetical protein